MPAVIQLEDFHKTYRTGEIEVRAVRGVNLIAEPGEFVAIMGSSGSGKSTLMNTVGCLDRPTQGKCLIDGVDIGSLSRNELADLRNRKLGFVFQGFNLLARTTALENVQLPMLYARPRITVSEQNRRAAEALELVGLGQRMDHTPSRLSGGQQQRVAIARALVNRPTLLLADEPTGNLDSRTSIEIMGIFQKLNDEGMTVVMVTHELDIAHYCKRIVVMRDGLVRSDAPVTARLNALEELQKLEAEQKAVQLNPLTHVCHPSHRSDGHPAQRAPVLPHHARHYRGHRRRHRGCQHGYGSQGGGRQAHRRNGAEPHHRDVGQYDPRRRSGRFRHGA